MSGGLRAPLKLKLADESAERVRASHDEKIRELQLAAGKTVGGRWLGTQVITASGFYSPTAGCTSARVRMTGPGGAGGTATGAASGAAAAAGGSSGVYLELSINSTTPVIGGAVSIAAGSATTLVVNGVTHSAAPGNPGAGMTAQTGTTFSLPGGMAGGSSAANVTTWTPGSPGILIAGAAAIAGNGASGPLGSGGLAPDVPAAGGAASGYGAGGAGAVCTTSSKAGGAGSPGVVIIDEYT